uniref:Reverse transcriptase domain-containing protein n=1 Tax=Tanacetum cinerariifolium TaxID=118510 RepID=A0A699GVD2_TANCI|nr:hypothetical protein [Tanacetum cinerariifolium]
MSSPNHPTFKIKDVFSSNFPDYVLASSNYFLASPGNTAPDSSNDFTKYLLATLVFLPLYDDPYMEVMQAYDATNELHIPPLQAPIASPTVVPPVLSLFDSRDFFPPEEISPPKDAETHVESSILVSPSSSIRSSSPMRYRYGKNHKEKTKTGQNEHEIVKSIQKPDLKTFSAQKSSQEPINT